MDWILEGRISDPELLLAIAHELGQLFYRKVNSEYEAIYFSGSKAVYFKGKLSPDQLKQLESRGHKVTELSIDEKNRMIKIEQ